jgi:DNA-binding MurR/RpiR family transcriptional regulator
LADIILPCHVDGNSLKNSSAAPISLINYIANALADYDYEKSIATLLR